MNADLSVTREPGLFEIPLQPRAERSGVRHWLARAQNVFVEWVEAVGAQPPGAAPTEAFFDFSSEAETMVLVFGAEVDLSAVAGPTNSKARAAPRSVCIVPPGHTSLRLQAGAACAVLASQRSDLGRRQAFNQDAFSTPDPRIMPAMPHRLQTAGANSGAGAKMITVLPIDSFAAPASNPRIKMLQSATISINWVEYEGVRDRQTLSPHSHTDLEQISLGVAGHFVHHLRQPWGRNADEWREDRHVELAPPSLMVVPINLIHTSEGVGAGRHLLIDIFSPPRRDFIAKGWVENAPAYPGQAVSG